MRAGGAGAVALVAPVLADEAVEAWNKGLHLTDKRFASALSRTVGDDASAPAACAAAAQAHGSSA